MDKKPEAKYDGARECRVCHQRKPIGEFDHSTICRQCWKPEAKQDVILSDEEICKTIVCWMASDDCIRRQTCPRFADARKLIDRKGLIRKPSPVEGELREAIAEQLFAYLCEVCQVEDKDPNLTHAKVVDRRLKYADSILRLATPLIEERVRKETAEDIIDSLIKREHLSPFSPTMLKLRAKYLTPSKKSDTPTGQERQDGKS